MRKVILLYNPIAGKNRQRRRADVEAAAGVLRDAGVKAEPVETQAAGSAGQQAREAIAAGYDTVIACGGDGTVHDIVQGLAGSETPLGVIPLGTGNSLGNDLRLPRNPARAAQTLLASEPRRITLGKLEYPDGDRQAQYFIAIAGAGVDARMLYQMNIAAKQWGGMSAYYGEALRLFLTHRFQRFEVEWSDPQGNGHCLQVTQIMAVRLRQFGGILRWLAPDAALQDDNLQLVLFRTANRVSYCLYLLRALLQKRWRTPGVELVCARDAVCRPIAGEPSGLVYAEADGELLGGLPVRFSTVPRALTLLVPTVR
ncbi:MAG TPA: diacylglycerol kinase family protein [Terracidiphilus sp.]|nr:diacylglycerol kinase family protein [Terracidiphilus sp.]